MKIKLCGFLFCLGLLFWANVHAQVHHDLQVSLDPSAQQLSVTDRITLPKPTDTLSLLLHAGLNPQVVSAGAKLAGVTPLTGYPAPIERLEIELPPGATELTLRYEGKIHHPISQAGAEYARGFSATPGVIAPEGVFLSGASYWVAQLADESVTFAMTVGLPSGWRSVSQGERSAVRRDAGGVSETWAIDKPQQEVYLIAAAFEEYSDSAGAVEALVFLRQPEPVLARKYLDATQQYIELYRQLIGPYPYSKFALVENFWETGYGMPSFTLLGPQVIRFPFILHSSYPHEILHNWWGNSVYIDYQHGNWAEGLTSYLADHLIQEQRGQGVEYRLQALQKYTDYVRDRQDFPLSAFRARHGAVTEAVGYGKTLMLFHMLRQQLGDERFIDGLRQLYRRYQFRVVSFAEVAKVFSDAAGQSLELFFRQWVERSGAPSLRVSEVKAEPLADGFRLSAVIEQIQAGDAYTLSVPIAVHLQGRTQAHQQFIELSEKRQRIEIELPARPLLLELDPEFDVFRRLDRAEFPPALTQAFGAEHALMVIPANAPAGLKASYEQLAAAWSRGRETQVDITLDSELNELPQDKTVWLFGWDNRWRPALQDALADYDIAMADDAVTVAGQTLTRREHSVVAVARHPDNADAALSWVATDNTAALPGLARKLPHYGKYGYLGFSGDEPSNIAKGQWPVVGSPLSVAVTQSDGAAVTPSRSTLAPRAPLAALPPVFSSQRMLQDIATLAAVEMAGRGLGSAELERAAVYIAEQFEKTGLQPGGDNGSYLQTWTSAVEGLGESVKLSNVIGVLPGSNPDYAGESVVLGAHYDHLGRGWPDVRTGNQGKIHPGADDNASGIAVMLELARVLKDWQPERTVIMVAFTGEEAGLVGSRHYVENTGTYPAGKMIGMLNLDTVGHLGSQPLLVLGSGSAREWVHIFRGAGYVTGVPVNSVADDFGASDQASFLAVGVPAVQFLSSVDADYHSPGDTVDKIDDKGLVKVAAVVKEALEYLATRPERLNVTLTGSRQTSQSSKSSRRALLGTVPDFTFGGPGVRLSGVSAETPAEQAGLREGDVVLALNDAAVADLRAYSELLKSFKPGERVTIRFQRDGSEQSVTATLVAR